MRRSSPSPGLGATVLGFAACGSAQEQTLRTQALILMAFRDSFPPYDLLHKERWFAPENLGGSAMGESESRFGRLRALAVGPDGALYLGTSNREGDPGVIREGDDRIVRIVPQ